MGRPMGPTKIVVLAAIAGLALAGCGNGGGSLFTGSISKPAAPPPPLPVVNDTTTRLSQTAWNTARAVKCGFFVDHAKLTNAYLSYEATQGATPEQLATIKQNYDAARVVFGKRIVGKPDYCTDKVVEETRLDIGRYLAGDFAPRQVALAIGTE